MLRDRSLLLKLTLSGFLVIGGLGLLWFCAGWYFLSAENRAAEIREQSDQVFIDMLQLRRAEKNFMLRDLASGDFYGNTSASTPSLKTHQERATTLQNDIAALKSLLPAEKKPVCDNLTSAVSDYKGDFDKLVAAYRTRGFEDWGFESQWRKDAAGIETILTEAMNDKLLTEYLELRRREKDYLLRGDQEYIDLVNEQLATLKQAAATELPEQSAELSKLIADYENTFKSHQAQTAIIGNTEDDGLRKILADAVDAMEPIVIDKETGVRKYAIDEEQAARRSLVVSQVVILIIGIVAAGVLFYLLGRALTAPLVRMVASADAIAQGDLTLSALETGNDETGRLAGAFNKMVTSLRGILSETKTLTGEVATASGEISTGAQQQLASLNQTATSLNEITATAEEFKATMQEFADRARAVQEAADETAKRSADGRALTKDSAARIEQVRANSQSAGKSVLNLAEQMQRIGEITATVHEIAEQTKLLALNASIEAARAGEEGRGFAVVATQVRELANQSKESAGRIEGLIAETQKSMENVVSQIQDGSRLSEDSADIVRQVSDAFEEIAQAIEQTREAMVQINMGARQQEQGINELVSSITEIDAASKESVAAAEQTQKSIVAIDQRVGALNQSMSRFNT